MTHDEAIKLAAAAEEPPEKFYLSDLECPWCGEVNEPDGRGPDIEGGSGKVDKCCGCGQKFSWEADIEITWSTKGIKSVRPENPDEELTSIPCGRCLYVHKGMTTQGDLVMHRCGITNQAVSSDSRICKTKKRRPVEVE